MIEEYRNGNIRVWVATVVDQDAIEIRAVELSEARRQADQINALRHEYPDGGWLSTLVWNTRNNYMAWPDGNIEAKAVQMIVEGFLAELEAIRGAKTEERE